ncbi:MAG: helix-turn-helix transcriptional regulator [Oceanospirillaceae bacterium]|nr:helix-turn-helix transcriptional regulator [Oceanospirillaceae bacterium]
MVSNEIVDNIHNRLRAEIDKCGLSLAEASRKLGEKSPQRLRDVISGRQKLPAEMLSNAAMIGVDIFYVLTGDRVNGASSLTTEETALVENYRASTEENKSHIEAVGSAFAQQIQMKVKKG